MNCSEFEDLLHRILDGEETALDPVAHEHTQRCATCRDRHEAAQLLLKGLSRPLPAPSRRLTAQIVRGVKSDRRRRFFRRYTFGVAAAAAVLAVLIPLVGWLSRSQRQDAGLPNQQVATKQTEKPAQEEKKADPRHEGAQQSDNLQLPVQIAMSAGENATSLLKNTTKQLSRLQSSVPLSGALDPAAQTFQRTTAGVTSGLQPVTRSAQRAVVFFIEEIPILR